MLELINCGKVNGVPNTELTLGITVIVANHIITRFLMEEESSCNILYTDTLAQNKTPPARSEFI